MSERALSEVEDQLDPLPRCLCGQLTTFTCSELWPPVQLQPCREPLCAPDCKTHRHGRGTMGYADLSGATQYEGDEPDADGLWEWLKSRARALFWSDLRKARQAYVEICANFPPPAPWPYVQLHVGRRVFESDGPRGMRPLAPDSPRLPRRQSF